MAQSILIALLLLFGIATGTSWFALGASALLVTFQIARFASETWASKIQILRTITCTEAEVGDRIRVGVQVSNESGLPVPWVLIEDTLSQRELKPPRRSIDVLGATAKLFYLRPKSRGLLTYELVTRRRGYFRIGPAVLETGDLLGLHRKHRATADCNFLTVLPRLVPLDGLQITTRRPMGTMRASRVMEDPTQMVGIRAYRPGDPLNRVHWKATARTGEMHSRVFQPTSIQGATLLLDMHRESNPDQNEPARTDLAVTAAASIVHTLYLMNQPFALISNGRDASHRFRLEPSPLESEEFNDREGMRKAVQSEAKSDRLRPLVVDPGTGAERFHEIHRSLARLERTDGLSLAELIAESESRISKNLAVLVVVQSVSEEAALSIGSLRRRGWNVSVILNQYAGSDRIDHLARLVAHKLPVFLLDDENALPSVCTNLLLMR